MNPYRTQALVASPRSYRHPLRVWMRRLWLRVIASRTPRLIRPQCWACGRTFKPARGAPFSVQCGAVHGATCSADVRAWALSGHRADGWPHSTWFRPRQPLHPRPR